MARNQEKFKVPLPYTNKYQTNNAKYNKEEDN